MTTRKSEHPDSKRHARGTRRWYRLPVVFLLLGIMSIGMLLWTTRVTDRQGTAFNFVDALTDMEVRASKAHLWFEKIFYGHIPENMSIVWENLDLALALATVLIDGGTSEYGLRLEPLPPSPLRTQMELIRTSLLRLKDLARKQVEQPETADIDSPLEREFDATFIEFINTAHDVEESWEKALVASEARLRHLSTVLLLAWIAVVAAAMAGLMTRERRRQEAEDALRTTNEQLRTQAEELRLHRENLIELVNERTSELTTANAEMHREMAEKNRVNEALRESRDRFERLSSEFNALLDAIPDALTLLSPGLRVVWANSGAAAMFGNPAGGIIGEDSPRLWGDAFSNGTAHPATLAFQSGRAESTRAPVAAPDGSTRETRVFPILDAEGRVRSVIEVATDITRKLTMEAEARRIAHLASIGELAAGVAHEINNPVSGIINYAQVLIDMGRRTEEETEILQQIMGEGDRVAAIVSSLLSFARETRTRKILADPVSILDEALTLCGRQIEKDGIILTRHAPEDLPMVFADPHQVEQVFLNLLGNARYALNQKYPASHPDKSLHIGIEEEAVDGERMLAVAFHDHGTGIPAEILDRVLDPFFSTKAKGHGTGLGLSISHGIVTDHGGKLLISSVHGQFTSVKVTLPVGDPHGDGENPGH